MLHVNNLYSSKSKDNFVNTMSTEVICNSCKMPSFVDT